jgi:uncharacterized protein with PIN domain
MGLFDIFRAKKTCRSCGGTAVRSGTSDYADEFYRCRSCGNIEHIGSKYSHTPSEYDPENR